MIGALLPAAELAVGVLLVAWRSAVPGVVAGLLLVGFTVVLLRARARRVPCLCFGAAKVDTPVGPAAIIRNGVLAALAVFAIGSPSGASAGATVAIAAGLGVVTTLVVAASR